MTPSSLNESQAFDIGAHADFDRFDHGIITSDQETQVAAETDRLPEESLNKPCGVTVGLLLSIPLWVVIGAFGYLIG